MTWRDRFIILRILSWFKVEDDFPLGPKLWDFSYNPIFDFSLFGIKEDQTLLT